MEEGGALTEGSILTQGTNEVHFISKSLPGSFVRSSGRSCSKQSKMVVAPLGFTVDRSWDRCASDTLRPFTVIKFTVGVGKAY